jgi:hypothetical protein
VLETFLKTCKLGYILKGHKFAEEIGLPGRKYTGKKQYLSLDFHKRICVLNKDQYTMCRRWYEDLIGVT